MGIFKRIFGRKGYLRFVFGSEIDYSEFIAGWILGLKRGDKNLLKRLMLKRVHCPYCSELAEGIKTVKDGNLRCPNCGKQWVTVTRKDKTTKVEVMTL